MDEKYWVDFEFLEEDEDILAILLFGSGVSDRLHPESDLDFCVVAPDMREKGEMRQVLKKIYENIDVTGKRYDVWLFEELALYMKIQVIEGHKVVFCRDLPELYEYFYFYRKMWEGQRHRQEMNKEELVKVMEML